MKEFNGHRSWNAWNIYIWITGDYFAYKHAYELVKEYSLRVATKMFLADYEGEKTPDGAVFNRLSVRLALEAIKEE